MNTPLNVGGQAVLEGVMMRAPRSMTVAVRTPDGGIALKKDPLVPWSERWRPFKWPVVRGTVTLFSSLALGMKALNFSAMCAAEEEAGAPEKQQSKTLTGLAMGATMALSVVLGLALFFYLPLWLTALMKDVIPATTTSSIAFNAVDGVLRIAIFLGYIGLISRMKDIQRVFQYHGAEHKAIYAYESGAKLSVESARGYPRLHPRCGTSFLLVVMVVSILVFSFVPSSAPFYVKAGSRLVFIPLIAGLSYEFIRYSSKKRDNTLMAALVAPGLWLQRLTTREPDDSQIEVALHALREALRMEGKDLEAAG